MAHSRFGFRGWGLLAATGAGLLALTSTLHPAPASGDPGGNAADPVDTTLVYGGSGLPIAPPDLVDGVTERFVTPILPGFTAAYAQAGFTPEGFYPIDFLTGIKSLPFDPSESQGLTMMNAEIDQQIAAGHNVTVFGYSQSAGIATQEEENLAADLANHVPGTPTPDQLHFVFIGDPGGAVTPLPDTPYQTDIYTLEYDSVASPPIYSSNILAELNAALGFLYVHSAYPVLTQAQLDSAFVLGTEGNTTEYLIPTSNLPLLDPLRDIPILNIFGTPLADLLEPDLKVLVNLGYGPDNLGYTTPGTVATGTFPNVDPTTLSNELIAGAQQGIAKFTADLTQLPSTLPSELSQAGSFLSSVASGFPDSLSYVSLLSDILGPGPHEILQGELDPVDAISGFTPVPTGPLAGPIEAINTLSQTLSFDYSELFQPLLTSSQSGGLVNSVETVGLAVLHTIGGLAQAADELFSPTTAGPVVAPVTPAFDPVTPTGQTALIMGSDGQPIPSAEYLADVAQRYVPAGVNTQTLFTPEGAQPLTGVESLPFNVSVAEGVSNLNQSVLQQVTDGHHVTVFGDGQTATIATLAMQQLANGTAGPGGTASAPVNPDLLSFVLAGDPDAPNGGLLERFAGLNATALGVPFFGATPPDTPYATDIYTIEYDGASDFPKYPINFLADLNAVAGMVELHDQYPTADLANAISLGSSDSTNYFLIPHDDLPLLEPLRGSAFGNALADLLQPDLKVLVNLGYGADNVGYSTPADVATPLGLFPTTDPETVLNELVVGAQQGFNDAVSDLMSGGPVSSDPASTLVDSVASSPTSLADTLQNVVQIAYNALFPTADIINTLLTSVPAYDLQLVDDNLTDPLNAIGLPIAADTGLLTLAAGLEYEVLSDAATQIGSALSGLVP